MKVPDCGDERIDTSRGIDAFVGEGVPDIMAYVYSFGESNKPSQRHDIGQRSLVLPCLIPVQRGRYRQK